MAKQIQLRRGTTTENNTFTGAVGELTYDTEKKQLRVHDGSTVGGNAVDNTTRDVTSQVENATETVAGKAKIATTAIAQAGVNDTDIITAKKLQDVENFKSGLAIVLATGVINISSGCITACSKSSTGIYNITLSNPSNLRVFATTTSFNPSYTAIIFYNSATSISVKTQQYSNSALGDISFNINVGLR